MTTIQAAQRSPVRTIAVLCMTTIIALLGGNTAHAQGAIHGECGTLTVTSVRDGDGYMMITAVLDFDFAGYGSILTSNGSISFQGGPTVSGMQFWGSQLTWTPAEPVAVAANITKADVTFSMVTSTRPQPPHDNGLCLGVGTVEL
ncbi:MAG: hypothetical protein HOQ24_16000 [Mycobacteriaceae bacterium]|nr:hypothetical protein [Mycobacteriaceae bacterium]